MSIYFRHLLFGMFLALLFTSIIGCNTSSADTRYCGPPKRSANGDIIRSSRVLAEFDRIHPRPKDGRKWYRDHVIPLACGGCDSVENLQWLPEQQWREKSRWERQVYGGNGLSIGCP